MFRTIILDVFHCMPLALPKSTATTLQTSQRYQNGQRDLKLTILFDTSRSGDSPFDAAAVDTHRGRAGIVDKDTAWVLRVAFDGAYAPSVVLAREVASCAAEMGGEWDGVAHKLANAFGAQEDLTG